MRKFRDWTREAKLITASLVGILLSVGLCGAGGGFDTHVTQAQIVASYCGAGLFVASIVSLLIASPKGRR